MVAACPFPANHGSAASIREMSDTLTDMGHSVHIVTYPTGQAHWDLRHTLISHGRAHFEYGQREPVPGLELHLT